MFGEFSTGPIAFSIIWHQSLNKTNKISASECDDQNQTIVTVIIHNHT